MRCPSTLRLGSGDLLSLNGDIEDASKRLIAALEGELEEPNAGPNGGGVDLELLDLTVALAVVELAVDDLLVLEGLGVRAAVDDKVLDCGGGERDLLDVGCDAALETEDDLVGEGASGQVEVVGVAVGDVGRGEALIAASAEQDLGAEGSHCDMEALVSVVVRIAKKLLCENAEQLF